MCPPTLPLELCLHIISLLSPRSAPQACLQLLHMAMVASSPMAGACMLSIRLVMRWQLSCHWANVNMMFGYLLLSVCTTHHAGSSGHPGIVPVQGLCPTR